jgi:Mn2+/Fe2+ NRAMP family transporter
LFDVIGRFLSMILTFALAVLLIVVFVTNRKEVQLVLDPFNPHDPAFALSVPFFWLMFALLLIGAVVGSMATWLTQSKWRRTARQRTQEAMRWKSEAERLARERDANVIERRQSLALAE